MDGKVRCADPGCQHVYSTTKDKCDQCSFPKEKSLQYFSSRKGGLDLDLLETFCTIRFKSQKYFLAH